MKIFKVPTMTFFGESQLQIQPKFNLSTITPGILEILFKIQRPSKCRSVEACRQSSTGQHSLGQLNLKQYYWNAWRDCGVIELRLNL